MYYSQIKSLVGYLTFTNIIFAGYFVESLAEGVAMSLRALLGEPCLSLDSLPCPDDSTG